MAASPILLRRSSLAINSLMQSDLALTLLSFARSVRFRVFSNRKNHVSTQPRLENTATFSLKWRLKHFAWNLVQGCRKFLGGIGVRFLTTLGVGVGFFVRLRMSSWIMFYITRLSWEFLLKWYNFFETFVEAEISCCVPRFPLILTAKVNSLCVKESESEILGTRNRIFYLRLRNPVCYREFIYTYWTNKPEYLMFVFLIQFAQFTLRKILKKITFYPDTTHSGSSNWFPLSPHPRQILFASMCHATDYMMLIFLCDHCLNIKLILYGILAATAL